MAPNKLLFSSLSEKFIETHPAAPAALPNKEIDVSPGEKAKGSFLATTFAADLAAVVVYCLKLQCASTPDDKQHAEAPRVTGTPSGLKEIFNNDRKNDEDGVGNFIQTHHTFGQEFPPS